MAAEEKEVKKSTWQILSAIDCNGHTEKKNGLTYLSWAWAWAIVKHHFPSANYELVYFNERPYLFDENLGYLVQTFVTIDGERIGMHLPVMDGANKAQKHVKSSYFVTEWKNGSRTGGMIEKFIEPANMFDINTTIMRCLTKNLAMFGLGHYIYAGEDLPQQLDDSEDTKATAKVSVAKAVLAKSTTSPKVEDLELTPALKDCSSAKTEEELKKIWCDYVGYQKDKSFIAAVNKRKKEITDGQAG